MPTSERTWPAGWISRPAREQDEETVLDLVNARSRAFYGEDQATRASVAGFLTGPRRDLGRDVRIILDEESRPAAVALVINPGAPYADIPCAALAHPRYEGDAVVVDGLVQWTIRRARQLADLAPPQTRVVASAVTAEQDAAGRAALERAGFRLAHVDHHMRLDLRAPTPEPSWPRGVVARTADPARDIPSMASVYREAWREHAGYVEKTQDEVCETFVREIEARCGPVDPSLWCLAVDGSEVVGMSLAIAGLPADPTGGYVYLIGVRPAWRRRGIALALLCHTFGQLRARGFRAVELDVDSANVTGALLLYERAGMRCTRSALAYELELSSRGRVEA